MVVGNELGNCEVGTGDGSGIWGMGVGILLYVRAQEV